VANDTRIVLGRLDQKLYASAESTTPRPQSALGSDMGEFFMPYPGTRINQEASPLNATRVVGSRRLRGQVSDSAKPNGQIWTGVVGAPAATTPNAVLRSAGLWCGWGTSNDAVDKVAAKALAESIQPWTAPASGPLPLCPCREYRSHPRHRRHRVRPRR